MIFFTTILIVILDQLSKGWVLATLQGGEDIKLIPRFLYLHYVENRGAAFGIFQEKQSFFIVITILFFSLFLLYFYRNKSKIHWRRKLLYGLLLGGALGNFIDRLRLGYVIDFIYTPLGGLYDFPVFNVADMAITVGCICLIGLTLWEEKGVKHGRKHRQ